MKISTIINRKSIQIGIKVNSKNELLDLLIALACETGLVLDKAQVKEEVQKRESILSTGIGGGIAIPHAKTNSVKDTICSIALLKDPVHYDSIDGNPVNIAILILGREGNVGIHLQILSKISRLLSCAEKTAELLRMKTADEVYNFFTEMD